MLFRSAIGLGPDPGFETILSAQGKSDIVVRSASFESKEEISWKFDEQDEEMMEIYTHRDLGDSSFYHDIWFSTIKYDAELSVRSCQTIRIAISGDPYLRDLNETTQIIIAKDKVEFKDKDGSKIKRISNLVTCREYKTLIIRYDPSNEELYLLSRQLNQIIHKAQMKHVQMNFIRLGSEVDAQWRYSRQQGIVHQVKTTESTIWQVLRWDVTKRRAVVFDVIACADARLALYSTIFQGVVTTGFVVILGDDGNRAIYVKEKNKIIGRALFDEDILNCNLTRRFYVSWSKTHVFVGRGDVIGADLLISAERDQRDAIRHLSVTSGTLAAPIDKIIWRFMDFESKDFRSNYEINIVIFILQVTSLPFLTQLVHQMMLLQSTFVFHTTDFH